MSEPLKPLEHAPEPVSPVRGDGALGPTEDLDRMPGGFPHNLVAVTAVIALGIAAIILIALVVSWSMAVVAAVILAFTAIISVWHEATRERDGAHPSR